MSVPVRHLERVWHVGTMNPADKRGWSLEGAGLSVSVDPDAWEGIARLGGSPWFELHRAGATFIDAHRLDVDGWAAVMSWGTRHGLCAAGTGWQVSWDDDDGERCFVFTDRADADREAGEDTEPVAVPIWAPTELLRRRACWTAMPDPVCVADLVVTIYAADTGSTDGVWWDDRFDPGALSAPRGVIVPDRLAGWTITRCR